MKRYISSASGNSSDSQLATALYEVLTYPLGMGDSITEIIEGLAFEGNIDLPEDYDADKMLKSVLKKLAAQRSGVIPEYLEYNFTEDVDSLLYHISTQSPSGTKSKLYKYIKLIYNRIGEFPGGDKIKSLIEENIFNSDLVKDNAAEVGAAIGDIYWRYIRSKEYGLRSNFASAVGCSVGCRRAVGGKYKYAFVQNISSYYYSDLRDEHPEMPLDTGYMIKFYKEGNAVCADVFNQYSVYPTPSSNYVEWQVSDQVIYTFTFTEFDEQGIDNAAHEIAAWLDNHVQDAIDAALAYKR